MNKISSLEDLAKAVGGFAGHFKKAAEHHDAICKTHEALAEVHKGHHEFVKAKHEAMDDGDVDKAYFGKVAELHKGKMEHHLAKAALHKAHGDHLRAAAKELAGFAAEEDKETAAKAAGVAPGAPSTPASTECVDSMIKETTTGLVKVSLEMLKTDPEVKSELRRLLLDGLRAELGNKLVPDHVRGALPTAPGKGLKPIPRPGGPEIKTEAIDPSLRGMVEGT